MIQVIAHMWPCLLAAFGLGSALGWLIRRYFSQLALRSEIPDAANFVRRSDLVPLAAKTDLPDFSRFAFKTELPDLAPYALQAAIKSPDLSGFALKSALSALPNFASFALKSELPVTPNLSGYALKTDIPKLADLTGYALKSDLPKLPDFASFALKTELPRLPDFGIFALRAALPVIPNLTGFALKSELPEIPDLSGFARKSEITPPADLSPFALRSELPVGPDLSRYALKSEIPNAPDLSSLRASISSLELQLASITETLAAQRKLAVEMAAMPAPAPKPDDLKLIWGVGPVLERKLHQHNVFTFREVALWTDENIDLIEPQLETIPDRVRREDWMAHARTLHYEKYGELLPETARRKYEAPVVVVEAVSDDLELIHGVGPVLANKLKALGVFTFAQVASWTDADIEVIEPKLDTIPDRIRREGWVEHAESLMTDRNAPAPIQKAKGATA